VGCLREEADKGVEVACEAKWWHSSTVHNTKTGTMIRGQVYTKIEVFSDATEVCSGHSKLSSSRNHIKLEYKRT
jgi:hypothetical protein